MIDREFVHTAITTGCVAAILMLATLGIVWEVVAQR